MRGKSTPISRICESCGVGFVAPLRKTRVGRGKYCSRPCAAKGRTRPILTVIMEKVTISDAGCYLFTGSLVHGYGQIKHPDFGRMLKTHRIMFELFKGPIPEGMLVLHNCPGGDNKSCCNPDHLYLGSQQANMDDAVSKGQLKLGESRAGTKLDAPRVRDIRKLFEAGHKDQQIANRFGVNAATINAVRRGVTWRHVA